MTMVKDCGIIHDSNLSSLLQMFSKSMQNMKAKKILL